jgi:hypothetical protein
MNRRNFALTAASFTALSACGYKVAGKADLLPKDIVSIGIPPFSNPTTRYKLTEKLPIAITREFLTRTKYQILPDATGADAILKGSVSTVMAFPTIFDPTTGRAAGVQVQVLLNITLTHVKLGTILYINPSLDFRQRYEISTDPLAYFDESSSAFDRLSRDVAQSVVTAILENF